MANDLEGKVQVSLQNCKNPSASRKPIWKTALVYTAVLIAGIGIGRSCSHHEISKPTPAIVTQAAQQYPKLNNPSPLEHMPYAEFSFDTTHDRGTFTVYNSSGSIIASAPAISGLDGYRKLEHTWTRNYGPLPPADEIQGGAYTLSTSPRPTASSEAPKMGPSKYLISEGGDIHRLSDVSGKESDSDIRNDFVLHQDFDPDVEKGTHGCVGIEKGSNHWTNIESALKELNSKGYAKIPMKVLYK